MEESIADLMIKHHSVIRKSLNELKSSFEEDDENIADYFNAFRWELEKHIFIEEKAIFYYCGECDEPNIHNIIANIMNDHSQMIQILTEMGNSLLKKKKPDILPFIKILGQHSSFEDKELYPLLDRVLSSEEKKKILDRIEGF